MLRAHIVTLGQVALDVVTINLAYLFALWFRFDCRVSMIPSHYLDGWMRCAPAFTIVTLIIFALLRLYSSIWQFAGSNELVRVTLACILSVAAHIVISRIALISAPLIWRMPVSYFAIGGLLETFAVLAVRFSYRLLCLLFRRMDINDDAKPMNVMIIGAGNAGRMILNELNHSSHIRRRVRCVIDDDPKKRGRYICGVPVVGGRDAIMSAVERYDIQQIIFAIPTATPVEKRDILNICKETCCEMKSLPGIYQLVSGEVTTNDLKDVAMEDLLGREPIQVNTEEIIGYVQDQVVMVTGGGGSIGSELCRQIARHKPKQLIIFDIYENNAYDIQQELRRDHPELDLVTLIGSIRDEGKLEQVFARYAPNIVYHAAAHKHVPLMETSPCEAIKNNVFGTYQTALAASRHGCRKFVMISTDKAVNPTNIMGATKRLCEMIIQTLNKTSDTEFVAVRFGNVLGSNGSVIPLFQKQIQAGGPVTVTHPDIIRYFMTIPEAVGLVLQAGAYAKGGEIFVLDMGDPVKIDDLARNLIKLSGHVPGVDIMIEYTGLRPGEKLYEEKLMMEEGMRRTPNRQILIGRPIQIDEERFWEKLEELRDICQRNNDEYMDPIRKLVPTYHPENSQADITGLRAETEGQAPESAQPAQNLPSAQSPAQA
jgi:FlaA1/EpsC-like NDP-sugar epimerase